MSRWGRPIKNKKRSDPRYFLNEQEEAESAAPLDEKEVLPRYAISYVRVSTAK